MSSNSPDDHGNPGGDGDLQLLAARLEHPFDDIDLLKRAVTHRSAASASSRKGHYERLEFLGDRVLGLVIAELLFRRFPREAEGVEFSAVGRVDLALYGWPSETPTGD